MKTAIYFLDASSVPEEEALLRAAGELSRSRQEKAAKLRFPEDRILSLGRTASGQGTAKVWSSRERLRAGIPAQRKTLSKALSGALF